MGASPAAPRPPWQGRRIVLGVSGGIAAYKCVQVARDLTLLGAVVDVVFTESASRFVAPLSFEGVTGRPVLDSLWSVDGAARHIRLGREADLVLVAPATADLMARLAQGRADDLLSTVVLVTRAPVVLAPAMNDRMWSHPQTRLNARHLETELGYRLIGPASGPLAAGEADGPGRLLEPDEIVEMAGTVLGREPLWDGRKVVVTAGPTREAVDPVRYLGNRSSGRMGYALAREARLRGAEVELISGPVALAPPVGIRTVWIESARELLAATRDAVRDADVVIYAAAVADFRPAHPSDGKIARRSAGDALAVELVPNPDIARETGPDRRPDAIVVGFALETEDLVGRAMQKLSEKGFDLIVANPATEEGAGFEVETNRVTLIDREGTREDIPLTTKEEIARLVLDRVAQRMQSAPARTPAPGPTGIGGTHR
jgi:phosphopantothenoylcysteine decarboxylase / phosphopantothenate---cysteine ligase